MSHIEPNVTSVYPPPETPGISHTRIALSAYYNWVSRGCPVDYRGALADWLAAEGELAAVPDGRLGQVMDQSIFKPRGRLAGLL